MFKYCLFLMLPLTVQAQGFLGGIFGRGESSPYIEAAWNCPQDDYPKVKQLRNQAKVKIKFKNDNGQIKIEFDPNVFNVNPLNSELLGSLMGDKAKVVVDYTSCLKAFKENVANGLKDFTSNYCAQDANKSRPACSRREEELFQKVDESISGQKYFKSREGYVKLPAVLPGSDNGDKAQSDAPGLLAQYCGGAGAAPEALFRKSVLQEARKLKDSGVKENVDCVGRYLRELDDYTQKLKNDVCSTSQNVCSFIQRNSQRAVNVVEAVVNPTPTVTETSEESSSDSSSDSNSSTTVVSDRNMTKEEKDLRATLWSFTPADFKLAEDRIKSQLRNTEGCSDDFRSAVYALNFSGALIKKYASAIAEKVPPSCVDALVGGLATNYAVNPDLKAPVINFCNKNPQTRTCQEVRERQRVFDEGLRSLIAYGQGNESQILWGQNSACGLTPGSTLEEILGNIKVYKDAVACLEIKDGETRVVQTSVAGLGGNYSIKQIGPNEHDILIGYNVSETSDGVTPDEMMARVKSCISMASKAMLGPNGQKLNLKILSPQEVNELPVKNRPSIHEVKVGPAGMRSNSGKYQSDAGCRTITHEVLHLLGLCDEYGGAMDGFDCRAATSGDSIMASGNELSPLVPMVVSCECQGRCLEVKDSTDEGIKDFYVSPGFQEVSSYSFRNKYCKRDQWPDPQPTPWQDTKVRRSIADISTSENELVLLDQQFVFQLKVQQWKTKCACPEGDSACSSEIKKLKEVIANVSPATKRLDARCPANTVYAEKKEGAGLDGKDYVFSDGKVKIAVIPGKTSILHPAHYERIAGGGCPEKAKNYNECAKWAYRSSEVYPNCEGRPAYCTNTEEYIGVIK